MNRSKSSRYHRAQRRAAAASVSASAAVLASLLLTNGSLRLRDAVGGSVAGFALILAVLLGAVVWPATWYRTYQLERQYELSRTPFRVWLRDQAKGSVVVLAVALAGAEFLYAAMTWSPWWWLMSAAAGAAIAALVTAAGPVLLLPLFHTSRPLSREALGRRLAMLSDRAGVQVLGIHEWPLGDTRRANAALIGAGATRRILLSDTLLENYSDDEIEVVLAHEMAHHVHGDVFKGLVAEFLILAVGFRLAAAGLGASWRFLGLQSPFDVAGLPLVLLVLGAVSILATPLLNALSRYNERRADRFALRTASQPDAFIGVVRRMAAQNLAEERPSRAARWLFHTHPPAEERIAVAQQSLIPNRESPIGRTSRIANPASQIPHHDPASDWPTVDSRLSGGSRPVGDRGRCGAP